MYTVGTIFQTTYNSSKSRFPGNTFGQQQLQSDSGKRNKEIREQMRLLSGSDNQKNYMEPCQNRFVDCAVFCSW